MYDQKKVVQGMVWAVSFLHEIRLLICLIYVMILYEIYMYMYISSQVAIVNPCPKLRPGRETQSWFLRHRQEVLRKSGSRKSLKTSGHCNHLLRYHGVTLCRACHATKPSITQHNQPVADPQCPLQLVHIKVTPLHGLLEGQHFGAAAPVERFCGCALALLGAGPNKWWANDVKQRSR